MASQDHLNNLLYCKALSSTQREEMFGLLTRHFEGVSLPHFEHDLSEKDWVIQIRESGQLVGFSSLRVRKLTFEEQEVLAIYSGDTIMAPEAWGRPHLARTWIAGVNYLRALSPALPCYWLLLTSGFRTYRFLPVFWKEFFPRVKVKTPANIQRLLMFLAREQYRSAYDPERGLVRFPHPHRLRPSLCEIPAGRIQDPNISFFLRRNPGHAKGDELVCLTEIKGSNMTRAGLRMIR